MVGTTKARAVGFNHIALEVGYIEEAWRSIDGPTRRQAISEQNRLGPPLARAT
jgi:hypothetical protein